MNIVRATLIERGWSDAGDSSTASWCLQYGVLASYVRHATLKSHQITNFMPHSNVITSKLQLARAIEATSRFESDEALDWLPRCFDLTPDTTQIPTQTRAARRPAAASAASSATPTTVNDAYSPCDREEFIRHFRWLQSLNVCRYYMWRCRLEETGDGPSSSSSSSHSAACMTYAPFLGFPAAMYHDRLPLVPSTIQLAALGLQAFVRHLQHQHDDIELSEGDSTGDQSTIDSSLDDDAATQFRFDPPLAFVALTSNEWSEIELMSHALIADDSPQWKEAKASLNSLASSTASTRSFAAVLPPYNSAAFISRVTALYHIAMKLDPQSHLNVRALWILKPSALSRGRGIQVVRSVKEIDEFIAESARSDLTRSSSVAPSSSSPSSRPCKYLVMKYLERPMLVEGKKFDARQWLLVTGFAGRRSVWIWGASIDDDEWSRIEARINARRRVDSSEISRNDDQDVTISNIPATTATATTPSPAASATAAAASSLSSLSSGFYLRFSSSDFTLTSLDAQTHLTNNSVQKTYAEFNSLPFAPGNMWSRERFIEHIVEMYGAATARVMWHDLWRAIERIALGVVAAAEEKMIYGDNLFELFGLDLMMVEQSVPCAGESDAQPRLRPYLLEVNASPTFVGIHVHALMAPWSG